MSTRTFTREELEDIGVPYSYDAEPGKAAEHLHEEQVATHRWESVHKIVFRAPDDGKTWCVKYFCGLTEYQDSDLWNYEDVITATEMEPYEVAVTRYRKVAG